MLKQKSCLRHVTFLSKSADYKPSLLRIRPFTLRAPGLFGGITLGCSRKGVRVAWAARFCLFSQWSAALVCLELLCQHWPFRYPSGKIKAGKFWCKRFLPTHIGLLGIALGGSFLLSSHQPWTAVLVAVALHLPPQKKTSPMCSDWLKYFGFCCAEQKVLWFILRCIRSPSPKQRKVFVILWHLA